MSLFGDSLLNIPFQTFGLGDKLQALLPSVKLLITNQACNGQTIANLKDRLEFVYEEKPDLVLMHWDTDVSDVDESQLTEAQVVSLRGTYEENLHFVVSELLRNNSFVILSGPGLLGEGEISLFLPNRFANKNKMLDDYRNINRVGTVADLMLHNVDYRLNRLSRVE